MENKTEEITPLALSIPIQLSLYNESTHNYPKLDTFIPLRGNIHQFITSLQTRSLFMDLSFDSNEITEQCFQNIMKYYGYTDIHAKQFYQQLIQKTNKISYDQFYQRLKYSQYDNNCINKLYLELLSSLVNKPHRYIASGTVRMNTIKSNERKLNYENVTEIQKVINSYGSLLYAQSTPSINWIQPFIKFSSKCMSQCTSVIDNISICLSLFILLHYVRNINLMGDILYRFIFDVIWNMDCQFGSPRLESLIFLIFYILNIPQCISAFFGHLSKKIMSTNNSNDLQIGLYILSCSISCINSENVKTNEQQKEFRETILPIFDHTYTNCPNDKTTCHMLGLVFKLIQLKNIPFRFPLDPTNSHTIDLHNHALFNLCRVAVNINMDRFDAKPLTIIDINGMFEQILSPIKYQNTENDKPLNKKLIPTYIIQREMQKKVKFKSISKLSAAYMSGILEYIIWELLEIGVNHVFNNKIEEQSVNILLAVDKPLRELFLHKLPIELTIPYEDDEEVPFACIIKNNDTNMVANNYEYDRSWVDPYKPFKCHRCKLGFASKLLLRQHEKKNECLTL